MDDQSRREFQSRQNWLQLLDQPNPNFSQFTQVPQLDAFVNANKDEILKLKKHSQIIHKILNQFIKPSHDTLIQTLDSINVDQLTQKIVMREKSQSQIFDQINEKFGDRLNDFENKVGYPDSYQLLVLKDLPITRKDETNGHRLERQGMPTARPEQP